MVMQQVHCLESPEVIQVEGHAATGRPVAVFEMESLKVFQQLRKISNGRG